VTVAIEGGGFAEFRRSLQNALENAPKGTMLGERVRRQYCRDIQSLGSMPGVQSLTQTCAGLGERHSVSAVLYEVSAARFIEEQKFQDEIFGPSTLLVKCVDPSEMQHVASELAGQLTATLHGEPKDTPLCRGLINILKEKVGRLVFNSFPTGVEVSPAMHHGGPYPATTDARYTSVGSAAVLRFLRPICFQDCPDTLLPSELRQNNPRRITRVLDGRVSVAGTSPTRRVKSR
jgi:NADP-dependent aldehyde dehydrogenase